MPIRKYNSASQNDKVALLLYNLKSKGAMDAIKYKFPSMDWVVYDQNDSFMGDSGIEARKVIKPLRGNLFNWKIFQGLLFERFDYFIFAADNTAELKLSRSFFGCMIFPKKIAIYYLAEEEWEIFGFWKNLLTLLTDLFTIAFLFPLSYLLVIILVLFYGHAFISREGKNRNSDQHANGYNK